MSAWDISNDAERISYRLDSVRSIIEILAERITEDTESSALWACAELLDLYARKVDELSDNAMQLHREEKK